MDGSMKTQIAIIFGGLFILGAVSCQVQEFSGKESSEMYFYATGESGTRTQINDYYWRRRVLWNPSDEITVFCKNGKGRFVSTNTEATADRVLFVGSLNNAPERGDDPYWAVYPHLEGNTFDGESVGVTLPSVQNAVAGNVKDSLLVSIARSWDRNLYFYNLCGILSIPVYDDGIKRIVFRGNDNEPLAGRISATFDESGLPIISRFDNPSYEITLKAPDSGTFNKGDMYNVVCFPGTFSKGYTIEFYREELVSIKQIDSPVTLSRSGFVDLRELYTGGTICSVESDGKVYSLNYKLDRQTDSTVYWISLNGKIFEIPEKFHTTPYENPTRIGPAIAIDTEHETVYFAKSYHKPNSSQYYEGVIYRITSTGYEKKEYPVACYPFFRKNENCLELHSFVEGSYWNNEYYHYYLEKMSYNHWEEHSWFTSKDTDYYYVDYDPSGFKKNLSDVIFLFQEKDIPNYPKTITPVDLGLSVKWGSSNLGATSPELYGDLYAWGETSTKDSFTVENYRFGGKYGDGDNWWLLTGTSKYNNVDHKIFLDSVDDAAHVQLGEDWRIHTPDEWLELIENCKWEWTFLNGVAGVKATSNRNGNCVFFPADCREASYEWLFPTQGNQYVETGAYHSSHVVSDYYFGATDSFFFSLYDSLYFCSSTGQRELGYAVRPVYGHIAIEEFYLDKSFLHISSGESVQLNLTRLPYNASNWEAEWTSSNESVAKVSPEGIVTGLSSGSTIITATSVRGERTASCYVVVDHAEAPEMVDMGLSVKWASFNVGASSPEEVGHYFAWGETEPKDYYGGTYKWGARGSDDWLTKYCSDSAYGFNGFSDNKTTLDPEDDAAYVYYGGKWRMPTRKEIEELCANVDIVSANLNGVDGFWVTSHINGNRIFFPLTGFKPYAWQFRGAQAL